MNHRIGEAPLKRVPQRAEAWTWREVVKRVEARRNVKLAEVQGRGRTVAQWTTKEALIYVGRERGQMSVTELARRLDMDPSSVSRGYERARHRMQTDAEFRRLVEQLIAR